MNAFLRLFSLGPGDFWQWGASSRRQLCLDCLLWSQPSHTVEIPFRWSPSTSQKVKGTPPWAEPFSPAGVLMSLIAPSGIFLPVVERRRRFNINDRIKELGMLIPKANDL